VYSNRKIYEESNGDTHARCLLTEAPETRLTRILEGHLGHRGHPRFFTGTCRVRTELDASKMLNLASGGVCVPRNMLFFLLRARTYHVLRKNKMAYCIRRQKAFRPKPKLRTVLVLEYRLNGAV
jgi:hypothetical protein